MLKDLIKMAGEFDRLGLSKEADKIDEIIRRASEADGWSDEGTMEYVGEDTNPEDSEQEPSDDEQRDAMVARDIITLLDVMRQMVIDREPKLADHLSRRFELVLRGAERIDELQNTIYERMIAENKAWENE